MKSGRVIGSVTAMIAATTAIVVTHIATAQIPAEATYKGQKICLGCHKITHPELTAAFEKTSHPKSMQLAASPGAMVAVFDEESPLSKDQIMYVANWGGYQLYISKDFKALRGRWNIAQKKWVLAAEEDAFKQVIPQHTTGFDPATKKWVDMGVTCESCHGTGSVHADTGDVKAIGNVKSLPFDRQAMICGSCHAKGQSKDGAVGYAKGYKYGADLNEYFVLTEVKTPGTHQQYNEWLLSKHAKAEVHCTICHEIHGKGSSNSAQLKMKEYDLCMGCHKSIQENPAHPKVTAADKCASCHMPSGQHTFTVPQTESK